MLGNAKAIERSWRRYEAEAGKVRFSWTMLQKLQVVSQLCIPVSIIILQTGLWANTISTGSLPFSVVNEMGMADPE